jgi:hypothetical protein
MVHVWFAALTSVVLTVARPTVSMVSPGESRSWSIHGGVCTVGYFHERNACVLGGMKAQMAGHADIPLSDVVSGKVVACGEQVLLCDATFTCECAPGAKVGARGPALRRGHLRPGDPAVALLAPR